MDATTTPPSPGRQSPDPAAARVHARHLARGQALLRKKQYYPAIEQFAAALEAWPEEPRALAAMGQAALLAGDLSTAESATRDALTNAEQPELKASVLHQLSLVADRRGDRPTAIARAKESLAVREDPAVRKWLASLQSPAP
jgi:tetratricopeptide (TPR) repeat protein